MPRPLGNQIISGLPQAHPATAVALDAIQYLINSRPLRQPAQLTRQILLQRLAAPLGPALQSSVHVVGDITSAAGCRALYAPERGAHSGVPSLL